MSTKTPFRTLLRGSSTRNFVVLFASMTGLLFNQSQATAENYDYVVLRCADNSALMVLDQVHCDAAGFYTDYMTYGSSPLTYSFVATRFWDSPGVFSWYCEFGFNGWIWEESDGWYWSITTPGFANHGRVDFVSRRNLPIIFSSSDDDPAWTEDPVPPPVILRNH